MLVFAIVDPFKRDPKRCSPITVEFQFTVQLIGQIDSRLISIQHWRDFYVDGKLGSVDG
jgi:hypothetical protein